jgi:hypothetical protein
MSQDEQNPEETKFSPKKRMSFRLLAFLFPRAL